jgi:glycosyltransferase involved in cell wall biosynthesis
MRDITFVIGVFGSGGGERNCFNLANNFVQRGIQVTVVAIGLRDKRYLQNFDPRVRFVSLDKSHFRSALIPLMKYLKKNNPTTVLAFNHYVATGLQLIRLMPGYNFSLYMRNIIGLTKKYRMNKSFWQAKIAKQIVKILLRDVDGIVSQCQDMEKDLLENWSISQSKSVVIYNPVSVEVEQEQKAWSSVGKKDQILYVGRLAAEKRVDILIKSFAGLRKSLPQLSLVILGEGELEGQLKKLCMELGISQDVHFLGFQDNPIKFYQESKVTALPSFSEGFPNVLIESITLGTPVVAFDCETGPAEIIKDGINGFLVPLGDEACFEVSLQKALSKDWSFDVDKYRQAPIVENYLSFLF